MDNTLFYIFIIPVIIIIVLLIIVGINIAKKQISRKKIFKEELKSGTVDENQRKLFLDAYGGEDNVLAVKQVLSRVTVSVDNVEKVALETLKELGATGVLVVGNEIKCSFGERATIIYNLIK